MIEIAGARLRYHAPLTRTIYLGKPPDHIADVAKIAAEQELLRRTADVSGTAASAAVAAIKERAAEAHRICSSSQRRKLQFRLHVQWSA